MEDSPQSVRLRFGAGLRFEESELDGEGEVTGTRIGRATGTATPAGRRGS